MRNQEFAHGSEHKFSPFFSNGNKSTLHSCCGLSAEQVGIGGNWKGSNGEIYGHKSEMYRALKRNHKTTMKQNKQQRTRAVDE